MISSASDMIRLPFRHRLEVGRAFVVGLRLGQDLLIRERQIQGGHHRLSHVPRRLREALDAVALGIGKVERPAATVGDRQELRHAPLFGRRLHVAQRVEVLYMERDLVEDAALDPTIVAALHERDLMMLRRVGAQEDDPRIARDRELPLVGDLEPEKLGIEAHHGVEIVCVDANVAEANAGDRGHRVYSSWWSRSDQFAAGPSIHWNCGRSGKLHRFVGDP